MRSDASYTAATRESIIAALRNTTDTAVMIALDHGVSLKIVERIVAVEGLSGRVVNKLKRPPASFRAVASTITIRQAKDRFGAGENTLKRWANETGATFKPSGRGFIAGYVPITARSPERDMSIAARAADECLRREARVFRCDADGRQNPNGSHWMYGRVVLTADELVERAERKGWRADAWKQVAA